MVVRRAQGQRRALALLALVNGGEVYPCLVVEVPRIQGLQELKVSFAQVVPPHAIVITTNNKWDVLHSCCAASYNVSVVSFFMNSIRSALPPKIAFRHFFGMSSASHSWT